MYEDMLRGLEENTKEWRQALVTIDEARAALAATLVEQVCAIARPLDLSGVRLQMLLCRSQSSVLSTTFVSQFNVLDLRTAATRCSRGKNYRCRW